MVTGAVRAGHKGRTWTFEDPYYDGTKWTARHFEAGGTTSGTSINMIRSKDAAENAATICHKGVHTGPLSSMPWREKEYTRPPKAGDSFPGPEIAVPPGGIPVDLAKFK